MVVYRPHSADISFVAHYPMRDSFDAAIFQRFDECEVGFFITVGREIIRSFIPLLTYLFQWNKLDDLNVSRWLGFETLQLFVVKNYKCAGFDLVALLNFFVRNFLACVGIYHVLFDAHQTTLVKQMKPDRSIGHSRIELYGKPG